MREFSKLPTQNEKKDGLLDLIEKEKFLDKLPKRKRLFVRALVLMGGNVAKAAKAAKISKPKAFEWLADEDVKRAIEYDQEILARRHDITSDYIIKQLKAIIEDEKTPTKDKIEAINLLAKIGGVIKEGGKGAAQQQMFVVQFKGLPADNLEKDKGG